MSLDRPPINILTSIAPLAASADVWLCDIWGVVHNGVTPFQSAVEACRRFRGAGGTVVLVSNAPRLNDAVRRQLDDIGVAGDVADAIVTSGDVTRSHLEARPGARVLHIGPERDLGFFTGLDLTLTDEATATVVVCTGLFDDTRETPQDYRDLLARVRERGLPLVCANPDIKVERGRSIVWCAGALAALFEDLGGTVEHAGKPHAPIYRRALETAQALRGGTIGNERILAIGDGVMTDILGANAAGIRSVYVASAIHLAVPFSAAAVEGLFAAGPARPDAAMAALAW
jgi:HAD superfamily hydrolase (TIGR01459 family)